MIDLAKRKPADELEWRAPLIRRLGNCCWLKSSDWAFIMRTGTMVPYAVRRTRSHLMRFQKLWEDIRMGKIDSGLAGESGSGG